MTSKCSICNDTGNVSITDGLMCVITGIVPVTPERRAELLTDPVIAAFFRAPGEWIPHSSKLMYSKQCPDCAAQTKEKE